MTIISSDKVKELIKKEFTDKKGKPQIEKLETVRGTVDQKNFLETPYPKPVKRHALIYENFGLSIEESYFWVRDMIQEQGLPDVEKIVDTFTASEQSSFFGASQQKMAIQQDRISSYMATIGKMVREMFQIVREIKLLDERETLYKLAAGDKKANKKPDDGAEKALKGIWIDFIDNGPQGVRASSVYGLASQIGYQTLPDLFFSARPALKQEDVTKYVFGNKTKEYPGLEFNDRVKTVLVRKLEQYIAWRDSTAVEISAKKKFTIQYLRQHFNSIKLYMDWVKPYLRNVKRMESNPETQLSADVVGAFEGAVIEIELLAKAPAVKKDPVSKEKMPRACVLATFRFRTRPIMNTGQDFQRGPMHIGRMELYLRAYSWSDEDIAKYKNIRMQEDFELIKSIDSSLVEAMDALGSDLMKYLKDEGGQKFDEADAIERLARTLLEAKGAVNIDDARQRAAEMIKKKSEDNKESIFEPFLAFGKGLKQIGLSFSGQSEASKKKKSGEIISAARGDGEKLASGVATRTYTFYKKSRRLVTP